LLKFAQICSNWGLGLRLGTRCDAQVRVGVRVGVRARVRVRVRVRVGARFAQICSNLLKFAQMEVRVRVRDTLRRAGWG
jgi:hypothetical protein